MKLETRVVYEDLRRGTVAVLRPTGIFILDPCPSVRGLIAQKGPRAFVQDSHYDRALEAPFDQPAQETHLYAWFDDAGRQLTKFNKAGELLRVNNEAHALPLLRQLGPNAFEHDCLFLDGVSYINVNQERVGYIDGSLTVFPQGTKAQRAKLYSLYEAHFAS